VKIEQGWARKPDKVNVGTIKEPFFVSPDEATEAIKDYEIINFFNIWTNTKRWGLPFTGGWAQQPGWVIEVLNIIETEWLKHGERKIRDRAGNGSQTSYKEFKKIH